MANFWKVNQQTTNGSIRYWDMIETMLAALWTMPNSGDGLTLGVPVTHGGVGAGGLGNNNAWVRMQDPGGGREIIIQRKNSDFTWDLVYSPSAGFTGGAPSATVRPTAADEALIINNASVHTAIDSLHHCWASDVSPYPFYLFAYPIAGGNYNHFTMMDEVETHGTDVDNVIFIRGTGGSTSAMTLTDLATSSISLGAWGKSGASIVHMLLYALQGWDTTNLRGFRLWDVPSISGSTADLIGPAFFFRRLGATVPMFKGRAKNFKLAGFERPSSGTTYTVSSARDRIYLRTAAGAAVLPWNGDIPTFP